MKRISLNCMYLLIITNIFVLLNSYELDQMADGFSAFIKSYPLFNQTWFAGGIVNFASVQGSGHYLAPNEAAFEDGTKNYLNIPAIKTGIKH